MGTKPFMLIDYHEIQGNIMRNLIFLLMSFSILICQTRHALSQTATTATLPFGNEVPFFNNRLSVSILSNDENTSIHTPPTLMICVKNKTNVSLPIQYPLVTFDSIVSEESKVTEARFFEVPLSSSLRQELGPSGYNGEYFSPEYIIVRSGFFYGMQYHAKEVEKNIPVYMPLKVGSYIYNFHISFLHIDNKSYSFPFKIRFKITGSDEDQKEISRSLFPFLSQFKAVRPPGVGWSSYGFRNPPKVISQGVDTSAILAMFKGNPKWQKHIAMAMTLHLNRGVQPNTLRLYKSVLKAFVDNCAQSSFLSLADASLWIPDGMSHNDGELTDYMGRIYKSNQIPRDYMSRAGFFPARIFIK